MKKVAFALLIIAAITIGTLLLLKPHEVGVVMINEPLDCDVEGSHYKITYVFNVEDSGIVNQIVLPRFDGDKKLVRKQYDSIYSQDNTSHIVLYAIGSYSLFRHFETDLGCTGAHSFNITRIVAIKRTNWASDE